MSNGRKVNKIMGGKEFSILSRKNNLFIPKFSY